jgi:hypothetical protein
MQAYCASPTVLYIFTTSFADNHGHTRAPVPLFLLPFRTFPDIFSLLCNTISAQFPAEI